MAPEFGPLAKPEQILPSGKKITSVFMDKLIFTGDKV